MAITITLYSKFQKRVNSTKQPSGDNRPFTVTLKDDTSRYYPVFDLHTGYNISQFNYVEWDGRYYYVKDIIYYRHNSYYLQCEVDVMASWKANIIATTAFVERSASTYNKWLIDPLLPNIQQDSLSYTTVSQIAAFLDSPADISNGTYIVQLAGVNSTNASITPSTQCFVLSASDLATVNKVLMSNSETLSDEINLLFGGQLTNAIIDVKYFPLKYSQVAFQGTSSEMKIGNVSLGTYTALSFGGVRGSIDITFNNEYTDYRAASCVKYFVHLPNVGEIELQPVTIASHPLWTVKYYIDFLAGTITYRIVPRNFSDGNYGDTNCIYSATTNISASIATSTYNANKVGSLYNTVKTGILRMINASILTSAKDIGGQWTIPTDLFSAAQEMGSAGVNNGGYALICDSRVTTRSEYVNTSAQPSSIANTAGRPCYQQVVLSSLSGYVKTIGASVAADAPQEFLDFMNNTLDGGAYIE